MQKAIFNANATNYSRKKNGLSAKGPLLFLINLCLADLSMVLVPTVMTVASNRYGDWIFGKSGKHFAAFVSFQCKSNCHHLNEPQDVRCMACRSP
jgi:hypothetical protein